MGSKGGLLLGLLGVSLGGVLALGGLLGALGANADQTGISASL